MLKRIEISGFQSHENSVLDLHPGVNVILGETDSGKTAILRALNWVCFNRPLGSSFARKDSKTCKVLLETDRGSCSRERRKGLNGYTVGADKFEEIGSSVPDQLSSVIHLEDINIQAQLSPSYLVGNSSGQISKTVSEILGFGAADQLVSLVRSGGRKVSQEHVKESDALRDVEMSIQSLGDLDSLESDIGDICDLFAEVSAAEKDIAEIESLVCLISPLQKKNESIREILLHLGDLEESYDGYEDLLLQRFLTESVILLTSQFREFTDRATALRGLDELFHNYSESDLCASLFEEVALLSNRVVKFEEILTQLGSLSESRDTFVLLSESVDQLNALLSTAQQGEILQGDLSSKMEEVSRACDEEAGLLARHLKSSGECPYCGATTSEKNVDRLVGNFFRGGK